MSWVLKLSSGSTGLNIVLTNTTKQKQTHRERANDFPRREGGGSGDINTDEGEEVDPTSVIK